MSDGTGLIISSRVIGRADPELATAWECSAATTCRSRPLVVASRVGCSRFMALAAPMILPIVPAAAGRAAFAGSMDLLSFERRRSSLTLGVGSVDLRGARHANAG